MAWAEFVPDIASNGDVSLRLDSGIQLTAHSTLLGFASTVLREAIRIAPKPADGEQMVISVPSVSQLQATLLVQVGLLASAALRGALLSDTHSLRSLHTQQPYLCAQEVLTCTDSVLHAGYVQDELCGARCMVPGPVGCRPSGAVGCVPSPGLHRHPQDC